ncbi:maleate cis-trans isomerase family protein [Sciscionella marina]|uniref:maleate cis-trans isomerase family protein n=1 Tax=Sciscionella marina TaxID=508770 RepID=UPI00036AC3EE|nr:aspartate/glutamate racemase family protein [Sciscionella marina]
MTVVGFIYPDHAAEDDYPSAEALLDDVRLQVVHTYGTDLHAIPELLDLGSPDKLAGGAEQLAGHHPDAVVWACTSGSFVFGTEGARQQVETLRATTGVPTTSTSFAFTSAAKALGLRKVSVAASYPADVADRFRRFLADDGIEIVGFASAGIDTAAEVGQLSDEQVIELVLANDHPDADAVLIPDTAMRTVLLVDELERRLGKPVLTANQVTIWEGLRLAGHTKPAEGLGKLFRDGALV